MTGKCEATSKKNNTEPATQIHGQGSPKRVIFFNKSDVLSDLLLVLLTTLISQKLQYKANILFSSFSNHVSEKIHFKGHVTVHFPFLALNTLCEGSKIREKGNDPEK